VFEAFVGKSCAAEDECFEVGECGSDLEGAVADGGGIGEVEAFECGGLREGLEGFVAEPGAAEPGDREAVQSGEIFEHRGEVGAVSDGDREFGDLAVGVFSETAASLFECSDGGGIVGRDGRCGGGGLSGGCVTGYIRLLTATEPDCQDCGSGIETVKGCVHVSRPGNKKRRRICGV
jgi:hypothetical protein